MRVCSLFSLILALQAGIYHGLAHLLWMTNEYIISHTFKKWSLS